MAGKADFTEAEWQTLEKGVTGAAMLVSLADSNLFDTFKEAGAMAGYFDAARKTSDSILVRDLAATHNSGFGMRTSPQELESGTLAALGSSLATLQTKAPDEIPAYRAFVLELAETVAKAVSGVAPAETAAIEKIRATLEAEPSSESA
jgi:hypothetical protein